MSKVMESSRVKDSFSGHHAPSFNYKNKEMLKQSVETQSHITELQTLTVTVHDVSHSAKTTDPLCSSWESFLSFCRMIHRRVCARAVECFLFFPALYLCVWVCPRSSVKSLMSRDERIQPSPCCLQGHSVYI